MTSKKLPLKPIILSIVFLLFLLGAAVTARYCLRQYRRSQIILVNGNYVRIDKKLEMNPYSEEDFLRENGRVTYLNGDYRTGIDVSSHQGKVNWKKVADDGISFAMLRCGVRGYGQKGIIREDETFAYNLEHAAAVGLDVGVYFFSQAVSVEEAEEEANFVLDTLQNAPLTLPVVFDWETITAEESGEDGARTDGMDKETVTDCALAFCRVIREAGYDPMVYFNNDVGYFSYDISRIQEENLPIWFASYHADYPDYYYHVDWWQYTDSGTVKGVTGDADLSIMPVVVDS